MSDSTRSAPVGQERPTAVHPGKPRGGRPGSDFARDPKTESGVRCLVHDMDWGECGCWCADDRLCPVCQEWSHGLRGLPEACVWCGVAFAS